MSGRTILTARSEKFSLHGLPRQCLRIVMGHVHIALQFGKDGAANSDESYLRMYEDRVHSLKGYPRTAQSMARQGMHSGNIMLDQGDIIAIGRNYGVEVTRTNDTVEHPFEGTVLDAALRHDRAVSAAHCMIRILAPTQVEVEDHSSSWTMVEPHPLYAPSPLPRHREW